MLGAVAAGALLGAARGYDIILDTKTDAGPDARADDEYKFVTAAGLEIVIGPKVLNEYDIASAVPSLNDNNLAVGIAVEGGDNPVTDVASSCPGGITLDASSGDIACYGVAKGDPLPSPDAAVTAGSIVPVGATITPTTAFNFATCDGDIDVQIGGSGALESIVCKKSDGNVETATDNTGDSTPFSFTVTDVNGVDVSSTFTLVNCPGGITLDKSETDFLCYGVERGAVPLGTNSVDTVGVGGSIVVTETTVSPNEKTTIAGANEKITVTGGDALASEGTNYKIELDTGDGAFTVTETEDDGKGTVDVTVTETPLDGPPVGPDTTRTVTEGTGTDTVTVTVTKVPDDGSVTETITVSDNGVPQSRKTTVTAPDANEDENIVDVTVTVTEETANPDGDGSAAPYFP